MRTVKFRGVLDEHLSTRGHHCVELTFGGESMLVQFQDGPDRATRASAFAAAVTFESSDPLDAIKTLAEAFAHHRPTTVAKLSLAVRVAAAFSPAHPDPIYFGCHLCHASPGQPCRRLAEGGYHSRRWRRAEEHGRAPTEVDVEHALARGSGCSDSGGTLAGICSVCGQLISRLEGIRADARGPQRGRDEVGGGSAGGPRDQVEPGAQNAPGPDLGGPGTGPHPDQESRG